jgi:hypothetical protein
MAAYSYSFMQLHLHCLLLWCLHLSVCTYSAYKHAAPTFSDKHQSSTIDLLFCSTLAVLLRRVADEALAKRLQGVFIGRLSRGASHSGSGNIACHVREAGLLRSNIHSSNAVRTENIST